MGLCWGPDPKQSSLPLPVYGTVLTPIRTSHLPPPTPGGRELCTQSFLTHPTQLIIYSRGHLLPHPLPGLGSPPVRRLSAASNSIMRKPELIQEPARAAVSGVEEHGVTAHYGSMRKGRAPEKKLRGWPHPREPLL